MSFRTRYLNFQELTQTLQDWTKRFPRFAALSSIGKSTEGRDLWLLTLKHPENPYTLNGPAVWVDGNMHATEFSGTHVALAIAEEILNLWSDSPTLKLPESISKNFKATTFYILPRMSPDGAETVLTSGRYVRSTPSNPSFPRQDAYWESGDIDQDGQIRFMRVECASGEAVASRKNPGLMLPRQLEDAPPYYRIYPEGTIKNYDGKNIPDPFYLSDNPLDFNRNFPWSWAPPPEQAGAGEFPGSAPEIRAVLEFATQHPNILVWLNLHTYGGVLIRPLGHQPDTKMNPGDLALYRQVAAWMKEFTGYPTVSGFEEFCYESEKPLRGDCTDFAYQQRGALAYVVELWDIFKRAGISIKKPFVKTYTDLDREDFEKIAEWDRQNNQSRLFQGWKKIQHPQLGAVEVGGLDTRVGLSNPPESHLDELCKTQAAAFLRVAGLLPQIHLNVESKKIGDLTQVSVLIQNQGYLSTAGIPSAQTLPLSDTLRLIVECPKSCELIAPLETTLQIGHLQGWGSGLYEGMSSLGPTTRGNGHEKRIHLSIKGQGLIKLKVVSPRTGALEADIQI